MRNPNRKNKPKHMTKIKYRRVELDWILVYQKNSKKISVKPPFESYKDLELKYPELISEDGYDRYIKNYNKIKHVKYRRYSIVYYLEK